VWPYTRALLEYRTPDAIEWLSEHKPQPKAKRQVKKGKPKRKSSW
jgi:hypothetical protein